MQELKGILDKYLGKKKRSLLVKEEVPPVGSAESLPPVTQVEQQLPSEEEKSRTMSLAEPYLEETRTQPSALFGQRRAVTAAASSTK